MKCFEELGLPATASVEEVKATWRKLTWVHHPDHGGNAEDFQRLNKAYKQALQVAKEPKVCKECNGTGRARYVNGWSTINLDCKACGGYGEEL